jgi:hypothetical protein
VLHFNVTEYLRFFSCFPSSVSFKNRVYSLFCFGTLKIIVNRNLDIANTDENFLVWMYKVAEILLELNKQDVIKLLANNTANRGHTVVSHKYTNILYSVLRDMAAYWET